MSMMAHPMHLHGHHFQVTGINGTPFNGAMRDTVLVPPCSRVRFAVDANNPAKSWAFHCHHLYHMASGMMTTLWLTREHAHVPPPVDCLWVQLDAPVWEEGRQEDDPSGRGVHFGFQRWLSRHS